MPKMTKPVRADGNGSAAAVANDGPVQVRIVGQYIKDLSFESPNIGKLIGESPEPPALTVEINVDTAHVRDAIYESAIEFKARAATKDTVIYNLEVVYGGAFEIKYAPPPAIEAMMFVNGPTLLFPFLRRLVADITREGGFPPLLLDPVDFAGLFIQKKDRGMPNPFEPKPRA